jgi:hypothetical protein
MTMTKAKSLSDMQFTLHCLRRCCCDGCCEDAMLDRSGLVADWTEAEAERLFALGWTSRESDKMLCPRCSSLDARARASSGVLRLTGLLNIGLPTIASNPQSLR